MIMIEEFSLIRINSIQSFHLTDFYKRNKKSEEHFDKLYVVKNCYVILLWLSYKSGLVWFCSFFSKKHDCTFHLV